MSPEMPAAGEKRISNGVIRQQYGDEMDANSLEDKAEYENATEMNYDEAASPLKVDEPAARSSESEFSGERQYGRFVDVLNRVYHAN